MVNEVINVFNDAKIEYIMYPYQGDDATIKRLEKLESIESVYGLYETKLIEIDGKNDRVAFLWGINRNYFDYWHKPFLGDKEAILNQFETGRYIITSTILRDKFDLNIGDTVELKLANGTVSYEIVGFLNTLMNNGNFIFIPEQYIYEDVGIYYYSSIMIKTINREQAKTEILNEFANEPMQLQCLVEQQETNIRANDQIFKLLQGFSIITLVIGSFGIFNNFMVSLLSRKRSLAIVRSIGMSKYQTLKMLLVEAITVGLIGGITGIGAGVFFISAAEYIMKAMHLPAVMSHSPLLYVYALIASVVISIIASLSPAIRSSKMDVIQTIKYE